MEDNTTPLNNDAEFQGTSKLLSPLEASQLLTDEYSAKILLATYKRKISAQEISQRYGIPIAACYRKIRILEEVGLIQCVERILTQPRHAEAVASPSRSLSTHPFFFSRVSDGRTQAPAPCNSLSRIAAENHAIAFHYLSEVFVLRETVRIQFHKILSEGRSVRYDPDPDSGVLHLSVIVTEDEARRSRSKRSS